MKDIPDERHVTQNVLQISQTKAPPRVSPTAPTQHGAHLPQTRGERPQTAGRPRGLLAGFPSFWRAETLNLASQGAVLKKPSKIIRKPRFAFKPHEVNEGSGGARGRSPGDRAEAQAGSQCSSSITPNYFVPLSSSIARFITLSVPHPLGEAGVGYQSALVCRAHHSDVRASSPTRKGSTSKKKTCNIETLRTEQNETQKFTLWQENRLHLRMCFFRKSAPIKA